MGTHKTTVRKVVSLSDKEIYRLFLYRCVTCNHEATEINHILPRSRDKRYKDDWRNKVPQCRECHDAYHDGGVSVEKVQALQNRRREILIEIGKEEYI